MQGGLVVFFGKSLRIFAAGDLVRFLEGVLVDLEKSQFQEINRKMTVLMDSIDCFYGGANDPIPEGAFVFEREIEASDKLSSGGLEKDVFVWSVDAVPIIKDITEAHALFHKNSFFKAKAVVESMIFELKRISDKESKYFVEFEFESVFLRAHADIERRAKTLFARYLSDYDAKWLVEKYVKEAFLEGKKAALQEKAEVIQNAATL